MYQTVHYDGELQSQPSLEEVHAMTGDGDQTLHWKTIEKVNSYNNDVLQPQK